MAAVSTKQTETPEQRTPLISYGFKGFIKPWRKSPKENNLKAFLVFTETPPKQQETTHAHLRSPSTQTTATPLAVTKCLQHYKKDRNKR